MQFITVRTRQTGSILNWRFRTKTFRWGRSRQNDDTVCVAWFTAPVHSDTCLQHVSEHPRRVGPVTQAHFLLYSSTLRPAFLLFLFWLIFLPPPPPQLALLPRVSAFNNSSLELKFMCTWPMLLLQCKSRTNGNVNRGFSGRISQRWTYLSKGKD
jgi:hypothetical protein